MRILKEKSVGLIIDLQERLVPLMYNTDDLVVKNRLLLKGLKLLDVPVLFTEQYPRGLGTTVAGIKELQGSDIPFAKCTFSCCGDAMFMARFQALGKKTVLIAGIEAHVCVLQTVLDLCESGLVPVVVGDAVSSRSENDKRVALERIVAEGGLVTTVESLLFELMRTARHGEFKALSQLIK